MQVFHKLALLTATLAWPLAQVATPDALSGGAGWVGTGLLGSVLAWLLLRHLPGKDAQLERLIAGNSASVERVVEASKQDRKEVVTAFREESGAARASHEREQSAQRDLHTREQAAQRDLHTKLYALNTEQHAQNTTRLDAILAVANATLQAVQDGQRRQNFHPDPESKK